MTFYLGIAALVAMLLTFAFIICGARYDDTLNNTTDEHSEWLGIGGGDIFQHRQLASEIGERNND